MLILEKNGRFCTSITPFLSGAALGTIVARGSYLFAAAITFGRDPRPCGHRQVEIQRG
jgi:hypothetical protein